MKNAQENQFGVSDDAFAVAAASSLEGVATRDVVEDLRDGLRRAVAVEESAAIASQAAVNKGVSARMQDGIGQLRLRVEETLFFRAMADAKLKAEYGENPWQNKKFIEKVWREHPECRVEARKKMVVMKS